MPHIEIKCYAGKTEEQKQLCAEKIAQAMAEAWGNNLSSISVAIKDVQKEDWKAEVWDKQIVPDEEYLYKKPGYKL